MNPTSTDCNSTTGCTDCTLGGTLCILLLDYLHCVQSDNCTECTDWVMDKGFSVYSVYNVQCVQLINLHCVEMYSLYV